MGVLRVIQPWFMLLLVRTFIVEPRDETAQYLWAAGVCLSTLLITLTSNPCLFYLGRLSQRCRISLSSLVQRKVWPSWLPLTTYQYYLLLTKTNSFIFYFFWICICDLGPSFKRIQSANWSRSNHEFDLKWHFCHRIRLDADTISFGGSITAFLICGLSLRRVWVEHSCRTGIHLDLHAFPM